MEKAFEDFKQILLTAFSQETSDLKQEIFDLKEQVNSLTRLLKEKDDQCRHIAAVLHAKNDEWKRIKLKLAENKRNKSLHDDIEVVIEPERRDEDKNVKVTPSYDTLDPLDALDDCTQLPPQSQQSPSKSQQLPFQAAETQSNLDALIDLISDDEGDETTDENDPLPSSLNISPKIQKRKSHARGCSCCDRFYSATRSSSRTADSFLASPNTPPGFWDTSFTPRQ